MNKKRILLFAVLHFAVLSFTFSISFSRQMARFEEGVVSTAVESALAGTVNVLATPMVWFWNSQISGNMGTAMQWLTIFVNSLLWGCAIEFAYSRYRQTEPVSGK